jgi:2-polyprenyl-6-methoxyphenol hydroxylase-like FAD-dependent oxidoreductase
MKVIENKKVLISGASIAGLSTAWWLHHIGYQVTVVEMAGAPRTVGGAVDLVGPTVDIAKRMGLYEQLKSHRLGVDRIDYKNVNDVTEGSIIINDGQEVRDDDIEIEREKFVAVLFGDLKNNVEFIFNNSVSALAEKNNEMTVTFKQGISPRSFGLVLGCDGSHSGIRKIWFGPEADYSHFLGAYFSISIVNTLLLPQKTMQMYSVPYKSMMLNAYNGKTDIIFNFVAEKEIPYDYRNITQQQQIILDQFAGQGWRTTELLEEVKRSGNFYFDKFCQIKMPSWTKGRVALIGDAAYCASPAAGQGASLSMQGAAAIADALQKHGGHHGLAFEEYERNLRPFIEQVQVTAEQNVKENFVLKTDEEIRKRNTEAKPF